MNWTGIFITLFFTTFTGWFTIWLVIKMLFHPRKPLTFAGFTIQGAFPKNQKNIAEKLGQLAGNEFLSFSELEKKITSPENFEKLKPEIEAHIDHFLNNKIKEVFPMLSMLIGEKTINQLKGAFLTELESLFPALIKGYMTNLQNDLNLEKLVAEKVSQFPSEKLEQILLQSSKAQLRYVQLFGAILGFVIGVVQVVITVYL